MYVEDMLFANLLQLPRYEVARLITFATSEYAHFFFQGMD